MAKFAKQGSVGHTARASEMLAEIIGKTLQPQTTKPGSSNGLPAFVLPQNLSSPHRKLCAAEPKSGDLVFSPWKGSWVSLSISLSCSASDFWEGKKGRNNPPHLRDKPVNGVRGFRRTQARHGTCRCCNAAPIPAHTKVINDTVEVSFLTVYAKEMEKINENEMQGS